jgi:predicted Zn-dependent protease
VSRLAVRLPALGESAAEDFNLATERRLGEQIMREIRRDPAYLDDPVLLEYLQSLWQPLVAAARQRGDIDVDTGAFAWEAFLVRDRSVNAFALPGGYVGVHLGLIALTATPTSWPRCWRTSSRTSRSATSRAAWRQRSAAARCWAWPAMLLGDLAASRSNSPDMAQAAIMGGQAAALQAQLNFSRDMEREADRIGWAVLGMRALRRRHGRHVREARHWPTG